jgi:hypothetical protein
MISTINLIRKAMKRLLKRNTGMLLLAIWLIAWGLVTLIPALDNLGLVLAVLAIAAGIFLLLNR